MGAKDAINRLSRWSKIESLQPVPCRRSTAPSLNLEMQVSTYLPPQADIRGMAARME